MTEALGILEVTGFTPAMAALDAMEKSAGVRLLQVEKNDFYGALVKVVGSVDAVRTAVAAGKAIAETMSSKPPVATTIPRPADEAWPFLESKPETSPLAGRTVLLPADPSAKVSEGTSAMSDSKSFALGLIETQGFTAVFEAIDSACKAANVEVLAKEKLGGGYITVVIKGDVAAVKAAVDAGKSKVEGLGKLIAAHVIPRPSAAVLGLLPK